MYRLAVLTSHVIQYQDPLFKRLASSPQIDLTVLFCSRMGMAEYADPDMGVTLQWDLDLLDGYRHRFLRNIRISAAGFWSLFNPGVVPALWRGHFDAVLVMGWGSVTTWLAFATSMYRGSPVFLAGDNIFASDAPTLRGRLRAGVLRMLFRRTAAFMLLGSLNGYYYRYYGADPRRFFSMPYAIDNERFFRASRMSAARRAELRKEMGIDPARVVILFSGKLIKRKNPLHVLQAYERMRLRDRAAVIIVGEGAERPTLETYVRAHHLEHVHFLGFVNQTRLPVVYGIADMLVLPSSHEHWGLVVAEAMACGLPVLVSDKVGACGDICDDEHDMVFAVGDIDRMAEMLDSLVSSPERRGELGARSLKIIGTRSFDQDVDGILAALRATVGQVSSETLHPSPRPG
jgi:glycosyltransferase involved in cell wall biosynthesis